MNFRLNAFIIGVIPLDRCDFFLDFLEDDSVKRYHTFVDETNTLLERCGMGQLYVANPYDAFLMICMLTDYPLGTYADVWEMSYDSDEISES